MRGDFIVITRDMMDLGLRGSILLVYALVYGFSKDGDSDFHGSLAYVSDRCGITRSQASRLLNELVRDGLLAKKEMDGRLHYSCCADATECCVDTTPSCVDATPSYNKEEKKEKENIDKNNITPPVSPLDAKLLYGDRVRLTVHEYGKLVEEYGEDDTKRLVSILDDYLVNHPKKYVSHYRAILSWCVNTLHQQQLLEKKLEEVQRKSPQSLSPSQPRTTYEDARRRQEEIDAKYRK